MFFFTLLSFSKRSFFFVLCLTTILDVFHLFHVADLLLCYLTNTYRWNLPTQKQGEWGKGEPGGGGGIFIFSQGRGSEMCGLISAPLISFFILWWSAPRSLSPPPFFVSPTLTNKCATCGCIHLWSLLSSHLLLPLSPSLRASAFPFLFYLNTSVWGESLSFLYSKSYSSISTSSFVNLEQIHSSTRGKKILCQRDTETWTIFNHPFKTPCLFLHPDHWCSAHSEQMENNPARTHVPINTSWCFCTELRNGRGAHTVSSNENQVSDGAVVIKEKAD